MRLIAGCRGRAATTLAAAIGWLALLGALAPAAATADIVSTFDTSDEGWVAQGDEAAPATFVPDGGNPGGYVSVLDSTSGGVLYWVAPPQFLGNNSAAYGNPLAFDLRQSAVDSQFEDSDVVLESDGTTLHFDTTGNPGGTTFTRYVIPMTESGWRMDSLTGPPATQSQFQAVLANLTGLRIRAEFRSGPDTDDLDNVILVGPQPHPVLSAPVQGETANLRPVAGTVRVDVPGDLQGFIPLEDAAQVPIGSKVDTTKGRVALTTAATDADGIQTADFYDGLFQIKQGKSSDQTTLRLRGKQQCGGSPGNRTALASRKRKPKLWGSGSGNFTSQGNHGSASVRGTEWLLFEQCGGITGTTVKEGVVRFRNFYTDRTTAVRAGQTVLARPPKG